jgi:hypothetical protein
MLVGCIFFACDQIGCIRVLGRVSFDCYLGSSFYLTTETHVVIAPLCILLLTPFALSPQMATPVLTTTLALSLLRRSLARSVCSDVPAALSRSPRPTTHALRIALNFSPQKDGAAAGRPAACATAKGAKANVDRAILRSIAVATTPPPISSSAALAS